jgi:selenocysteine lyase/cysteine desulfurase
VGVDAHELCDDEAGFEDGTINFLGLPAVEIGLRYLSHVGIDAVHGRVQALTGWLLDLLTT